MNREFNRLVGLLEKRRSSFSSNGGAVPFAIRTRSGPAHIFGSGEPEFTVVVNDRNGLAALTTLDKTTVAEAYMAGALDLEGNLMRVLSIRSMFDDRHPLRFMWRFVQPLLFGQVERDKKWISEHYDYEQDFYLLFLDPRHRCYSQGIFASDDEPLEDAMTRKLEFAVDAVGAKPGDRVLDIGGGWGAFTEFAGKRGIHVTSLTISEESERFLNELIARENLPCRVLREHLFEHQPGEKYDAIVNLGVTEHLPDYPRTLKKYQSLLKPGGRIYLDASATRAKHNHSTFLERYIYPGNGSLLCLHEYLAAVAQTPFQLQVVYNDRHNYHLTSLRWAENLDRGREEIERRWGKELYRKFQIYLWGCADGFQRDMIQAYRWVMLLPEQARTA
ncbi:MAG TPA: class I SAM-dependent methyltransferase [Longimicrobiaceae bacterium]|nr:class I SAM-dependent methyltransferase [Longimicrobiaceae bacterium]